MLFKLSAVFSMQQGAGSSGITCWLPAESPAGFSGISKNLYQIFIEPKGDQFLDANQTFDQSKEGWKEKFLLEIESKYSIDLKLENKDFRLLGLPFCNEGQTNATLRENFEEAFSNKLLKN